MPNQPRFFNIFNYVGSQIGWLTCVIGAARGLPWAGPIFAALFLPLHLWGSPQRWRELSYILAATLLGSGVDSLKKASGLLTYASDTSPAWLAPIWIVAMWLLFSSTFNASFSWLKGRYGGAILFGVIGGPLAYIAGERLGGVTFNFDWPITIVSLALIWGGLIPSLVWLAERIKPNETGNVT